MLRRPVEPSQYTSLAFGRRLRESGIAASMGSVGDCYDNAPAESFFATLETELIDRSDWASPAEAKAAVFEYIEVFYNRIRRHISLDNLSPEQFEARYRSAPATSSLRHVRRKWPALRPLLEPSTDRIRTDCH